jgi:hypothetical protein
MSRISEMLPGICPNMRVTVGTPAYGGWPAVDVVPDEQLARLSASINPDKSALVLERSGERNPPGAWIFHRR